MGSRGRVLRTVTQGITQAIATLHEHSAGRWAQLVGSGAVNAVEVAGLAVGDVVEVRLRVVGRMGLMGLMRLMGPMGIMGLMGIMGYELSHKLAAEVGELTAGNEVVEIGGQADLMALVGRVAQFRQLANDVLALRLLSRLVLTRQFHADST